MPSVNNTETRQTNKDTNETDTKQMKNRKGSWRMKYLAVWTIPDCSFVFVVFVVCFQFFWLFLALLVLP